MKTATRMTTAARVIGVVVTAAWMIGCHADGGGSDINVESMLSDMSPGFETVGLSHQQRLIRQARAVDLDVRQLADDIDHFLFLDRPLRLSIYPIH